MPDKEQPILLNEVTYTTLAKSLAHDITETLAERTSRSRNFLAGFSALAVTILITLLGVGVPLYISDQVEKKFHTFRERELTELYFLRDMSVLDRLMSNVDPTSQTVFAQLTGVQDQVRHIEVTYLEQSEMRSERTRALANQIDDRRAALFEEFATTPGPGQLALFVRVMAQISEFEVPEVEMGVQALGRELIGAPTGASEWMNGDGDIAAMFPIYLRTAERARQKMYPELTLLYEMIRMHMEDANHEELPYRLKELVNLNPQDKGLFVIHMSKLLTQTWHPRPDQWSTRISDRAAALIADHRDNPVLADAYAAALEEGFNPNARP